jgi:hypothetical protein
MSIKTVIFDICKEISKTPERKEIEELLRDLSISKEGENPVSHRGTISYMSRRFMKQFLGFLHFNTVISNNAKNVSPKNISPLTEKEAILLEKGHNLILYIHKLFFDVVDDIIPDLSLYLNIYNFDYSKHLASAEQINVSDDLISNLTKEINTSAVVELINKIKCELDISTIQDKELFKIDIKNINKELSDSLANKVTANLSQYLNFMNHDSKTYNVKKLIYSLIYLRSTITTLSQLIYQSFISDKFTVYNFDNIIEIKSHVKNAVGERLEFLSSGADINSEPNNIVFVDLPFENNSTKGIYFVWTSSFSLGINGPSYSKYLTFSINDDLSYYSHILTL